jgi:hypothetical protein
MAFTLPVKKRMGHGKKLPSARPVSPVMKLKTMTGSWYALEAINFQINYFSFRQKKGGLSGLPFFGLAPDLSRRNAPLSRPERGGISEAPAFFKPPPALAASLSPFS